MKTRHSLAVVMGATTTLSLIAVNPALTSRDGSRQKLALSERTDRCSGCSLTVYRDENAKAADLDFLCSTAGETLLARAAKWVEGGDPVQAVAALRREYPAEQVAVALEQAVLRRRARAKFADADRMLFTRTGLEQASGDRVARWRARRYGEWPLVADLCCGIGGDTGALAVERSVVAVDRNPLHARLAGWNARSRSLPGTVWPVVAELPDFVPRVQAAIARIRRGPASRRRLPKPCSGTATRCSGRAPTPSWAARPSISTRTPSTRSKTVSPSMCHLSRPSPATL